ncbi:MAG: hypothetical protein ACYDBJ_15730 [Aggregatilineales bacterium]
MKRLGCLFSGCLGLGIALSVLVVVTLVFMAQHPAPTVPALAPPVSPTAVMQRLPATPTDAETDSGGIVLVTAQIVNNTPLTCPCGATPATPLPSITTPPAPVAAPFFSSQTAAAQQSATVMWTARTAWFAALTQGALAHAATLRALGTPGR